MSKNVLVPLAVFATFVIVCLTAIIVLPGRVFTYAYSWQHRCGISCERALGPDRMRWLDQMGCDVLEQNTGERRTDNQAAWDAAIQDRIDAMNCEGSNQ